VAHTCNPSYSAGRDQEDHGSKEVSPGKYFARPYLEKPYHKKWLVEWLKVYAMSSNASTTKKKKKEREREMSSGPCLDLNIFGEYSFKYIL
jgi:hypothetical protein